MSAERILMIIRTDVPAEMEAAWNTWYDTRHIPARLDTAPGFICARRFVAIDETPRHMTLYDIESTDALSDDRYLRLREAEASLPPDSFEALTPKLPNFSRRLFRQIYPGQDEYRMPDTKIIFVVAHDVPHERTAEFNAWYDTEHIPAMMGRVPGFVTARRFEAIVPDLPPRQPGWLTSPKYLTLYDLSHEKVLQSEAFLRETQSPWSTWVRSWYTKRWRFLARRIFVSQREQA